MGIATACEFEDYNLSDLDTDNISISTGLPAPIGRSSITIKDLLEKQDIDGMGYDSTGMVIFRYDTIQHFDLEGIEFSGFDSDEKVSAFDLFEPELKKAGVESWEDFIALDAALPLHVEKGTEMTFEADVDLSEVLDDYEDQRIDSIWFKKAPVSVKLSTNINGLLDGSEMTLGLIDNGKVIGKEHGKATEPFTFDLSKNIVRLNSDSKIKFGGALITNSDKNVSIDKNSQLIVSLHADDGSLLFSKVWGVFANIDPIKGAEDMAIDLYNKNKEDGMAFNLQLVDPKLSFGITSNIGIPFSLNIDRLEASNDKDSKKAVFDNGKNNYNVDLAYAKNVGDKVQALDETFDAKNGKIDELLNLLPDNIGIDYTFEAVSADKNSQQNYFLTDDAFIDLTIAVDMPAYIRKGSFITISDTIKDIEYFEDIDTKYTFDKVKVKAEVVNSLPFDAEVRLIFLQEDTINGNIVVSAIPNSKLAKSIKVKSGVVNSNDEVTKPTKSLLELAFEKEDIPSLKKAKHVRMEYDVAVKDFDKVKVSRDNALKVDLKAYVKGEVYINEF